MKNFLLLALLSPAAHATLTLDTVPHTEITRFEVAGRRAVWGGRWLAHNGVKVGMNQSKPGAQDLRKRLCRLLTRLR